ncbi:MAG: peptide deformylase [Bacteroidetes bacterium]|nr:peptide deformylase [Bacteroidota bacterium]MCY4204554.1 peptide deformylase [Bacteroidota bacterium]
MAIRPIRLYGDPVLRQRTKRVESVDAELRTLIDDMIDTMRNAEGIGLAAPQIGRLERIFVVDVSPMKEEMEEEFQDILPQQPMVLVNPELTWESELEEKFEEGCLSIPDLRELVVRPESIEIAYQDVTMQKHSHAVGGILARVFQHEYDHLEGVLFTDHISPFRRSLLKRKLTEISQGDIQVNYPVQSV